MTIEDIYCGYILVGLFVAWIALDWYGHKTGEIMSDDCPICGVPGVPCGCGDEEE